MRLIAEANNNPELFSIQVSCTGHGWDQGFRTPCGRLWEITARDILRREHKDYAGYSDSYYGFICPKCGCFTEIESSKLKGFPTQMARIYVAQNKPYGKSIENDQNGMGI